MKTDAGLKAIRTILENAAASGVEKTPVLKADGTEEIDKATVNSQAAAPSCRSSVKEESHKKKDDESDDETEEGDEEGHEEGLRDPKDNPCWKGYHPVGTKKKNGRTVPNCVPMAQEGYEEDYEEDYEEGYEEDKDGKEDDKEHNKKDDKEEVKEEEVDLTAFTNLLNQQTDLSEDFKDRLTAIFEAALNDKVNSVRQKIADEHDAFIQGSIKEFRENHNKDIASKLDTYLNYVAEEYMIENKLEIDNGLKIEISESFISGLKNLFTQHAIEIPETSVNVLKALTKRCSELEEQLNAQINENAELVKANRVRERTEIVNEQVKGLSETDAARFLTLVEDITYTTPAQLAVKLKTIKESFVSSNDKKVSSPIVDDISTPGSASTVVLSEDTQTSPLIAAALQQAGRFRK